MCYCSMIIWKGHPSQDYFSPKGALRLFWLYAIYVLCMQRPAILLLLLPEVPRHLMLCDSHLVPFPFMINSCLSKNIHR
jgi:hypothetical protein